MTENRGCPGGERGGEPGDNVQSALLTSRAASIERRLLLFSKQSRRYGNTRSEMEPAQRECLSAVSIRQESEVADLDKAGRQDVEQEATDELHRIELHDLTAVVVFGVAPAKTHLTIDQAQQSAVGNGDAMSIAGQILQHMLGTPEGRLGRFNASCQRSPAL